MNVEYRLKQEFQNRKMNVVSDSKKLQETIDRSRAVYQKTKKRGNGINLFWLAIRQIPYMGKQTWMLQVMLSFFLMAVWKMQMLILRDAQMTGDLSGASFRISVFLCMSGLLAAWSNVPLLFRSVRWKMAETEAAAGCSASRIYLARLIITGMGTMVMIAGVSIYMSLREWVKFRELGAYLFLPFLLLGSLILYFLRKARWNRFLFQCSGAGVLLLLLFAGIRKWSVVNGYLNVGVSVWILCAAAAAGCGAQFWLLEKEEKNQWNLA